MSILGRLNGIVSFIENPCNEPWVVYLEAAKPWANKAAMSLLGVDMMQTVRTALNPGNLRSEPHMRRAKGKKGVKSAKLPGVPDPYEYFGHILKKPIDKFIKANATWGTKAIFVVTNVVESGLWHYMVFDELTKFLYHSLADARKSEYCRRWNNGDGLRSGGMLGGIIPGWSDMLIPNLHYDTFPVQMPFHGTQMGTGWSGELTLVASFSGLAVGGAGTQVHGFRIFNGVTGEVMAQIDPAPYATGQPVEFVLSASAQPPCILYAQKWQEFGTLVGTGILMATFSGGRKKDPGTKVPARKVRHLPHPKRKKKGKYYETSDGSKVYNLYNAQVIKPPKKPKP